MGSHGRPCSSESAKPRRLQARALSVHLGSATEGVICRNVLLLERKHKFKGHKLLTSPHYPGLSFHPCHPFWWVIPVVWTLAAAVLSMPLSFPIHRWHHQLELHPPGTVSAALYPLTELLCHRPFLPGQLPDAEGVAQRGHHPHPAPGRG